MATHLPQALLERYQNLIVERLSEKRVQHSLSVAAHLCAFGQPLGLDVAAMETAGLLHDCCRALSDTDMLACARSYGIAITAPCEERPLLLHGPVGAEYVRRELGVLDEDIYEAIYWHTTGHPNIGLLAQALFVADFSEPLRKYPEAATTRAVLQKQGFSAALLYVARTKLAFARNKDVFHPETAAFCEWVEVDFPGSIALS